MAITADRTTEISNFIDGEGRRAVEELLRRADADARVEFVG
jgi:hypothetical protein